MDGTIDGQYGAEQGAALLGDARSTVQRLFDTSYVSLVRLAAATLRNPSWAEDVVQDCFARLQRKLRLLDDPDRAAAYLRTSVLNRARDELRRRGRAERLTRTESAEMAPGADDEVLTRLRRSALLDAIESLPRRQRAVVLLRFVHDLTLAETAETLQITVGAVKASQHRAMDTLKQRWNGRL